jgi:hypothetical protein
VAAVAAVTALPLAVLAARLAAYRGHVFLRGDFALLDIATQRAARWNQLLGAYDRFGWRHPGPAYFYLLAATKTVVGSDLGAQAQMVLACTVNGASAALSVWVLALRSRRPKAVAVAVAALTLGAMPLLGQVVMLNPWTPYVTVMPLFLLIALVVASAKGSLPALAGVFLTGSLIVQTDLGTAPLVAVLVLGAAAACVVVRAGHRAGEGTEAHDQAEAGRPRTAGAMAGGLVALGLASWAPVLVEQATTSPGNLTLIWRFFTANHTHPGLAAAAGVVGSVQGTLFGLRHADGWGLAVGVLPGLAGILLGSRWRVGSAVALAVVGLVGTGVAVSAASAIVGPPYLYLVEWSVAPALSSLTGLSLAIVDRSHRADQRVVAATPNVTRRLDFGGAWLAVPAAALAGCLLKVFLIPAMPHYDAPEVRRAWSELAQPVLSSSGPVYLDIVDPSAWALAAGLADEIRDKGRQVVVPPAFAFQYGPELVGTTGALKIWVGGPARRANTAVGRALSVGIEP